MKKLINLLLSFAILISYIFISPVAVIAAGETSQNPILLDNTSIKAFQGGTLGDATLKYYKLTENVTLTEPIKSISNASLDGNGFSVTLDFGENYTTSNMGLGMFCESSKQAEIKNLIIKGEVSGKITHSSYAAYGALIGYLSGGTVEITNVINAANVTADATSTGGNKGTGGFIGIVRKNDGYSVSLTNCYNYGTVIGYSRIGGFVGMLTDTNGASDSVVNFKIDKCGNYGVIESNATGNPRVAGIFNGNNNTPRIQITNTFNAGVLKKGITTSICYINNFASDSYIKNCFNTADILTESVSNNTYSILSAIKTENYYEAGLTKCITTSTDRTNLYYLTGTVTASGNGTNIATALTVDEADGPSLPQGFSDADWEYVEFDTDDYYKYPQLKGNTLYNDYKKFSQPAYEYIENASSQTGDIIDLTTETSRVVEKADIFEVSKPGYQISLLYSYPGIINTTMIKTADTPCDFKITKSAEIYLATKKDPALVTGLSTAGFKALNNDKFLAFKNGQKYYLSSKTIKVTGESEGNVILSTISDLSSDYVVFVKWLDNKTLKVNNDENATIVFNNSQIANDIENVEISGYEYTLKVTPDSGYYIEYITVNGVKEIENVIDNATVSETLYEDTEIEIKISEYTLDIDYITDISTSANGTLEQTIYAFGNAKEFMAGKTLTFIVTDGTTYEQNSCVIESDGSYEVSILTQFDGITLNISATIDSIAVNLPIDKINYQISSLLAANTLVSELNNKNNVPVFPEDLRDDIINIEDLKFDVEIYKIIGNERQIAIANDILSFNGLYTIEEINNIYDTSLIINTFSNQENTQIIEKAIDKYKDTLLAFNQSSVYSTYNTSVNKNEIHTLMANVLYQDIPSVVSRLETAVSLSEIKNVENYTNILGEISKYISILETDNNTSEFANLITQFGNMTDTKIRAASEYVLENISSVTTKEGLKSIVDYAVTNAQALADSKVVIIPGNTGGFGGGFGGGGGGGGYVEKETIDITDNNNSSTNLEVIDTTGFFDDINGVSWANEAINVMFKLGVIDGREKGKFYPSDNITRAEFVKIVVTAFDLYDENATCNFDDVNAGNWAYSYIASAKNSGVASGKSASYFGASEDITRQEMAVMLMGVVYRLSLHESFENRENQSNNFTDADDIADYALQSINILSAEGLLKGYEDGTIKPNNNSTRAEAVHLLYTVYKHVNK